MIDKLLELVKIIQSGDALWISVILTITLIPNLGKIYDFLETRKKSQINRLIEAINCTYIDDKLKQFFQHEIQKEYFRFISELSVEQIYRDKLLVIHERANGDLPFHHFKKAYEYLEFKNGNVDIKISKFNKIYYWYNFGVTIIFSIWGVMLLVLNFVFFKDLTVPVMWSFFRTFVVSFIVVIFTIKEVYAYRSAIKIQNQLAQIRDSAN